MEEVSRRLCEVEDRLARLLASGWQNAHGEVAELAAEAAALAPSLPALAARIEAVAAAPGPGEALPAITMAMAACRLVRARLATHAVPPGPWVAAGIHPTKRQADRLLPVGRMSLGTGEAWAVVRLRGSLPSEFILLTPPTALPPDATPWLQRPLQGLLQWQSRYPLGASGEVQACDLAEAEWLEVLKAEEDPLVAFRAALTEGRIEPGQTLFAGGGALRVIAVDPAELRAYAWPDATVAETCAAVLSRPALGIGWVQGAVITPLALLDPGGAAGGAKLVHLVAGTVPQVIQLR